MPFLLLLTLDGRDAILDFLVGTTTYAYRHLHFPNESHIVLHNHHPLEGLLVFVSGLCLLDRNLLCSHQNGIKLKHGYGRQVSLGRMFARLNDRDHSYVDVVLQSHIVFTLRGILLLPLTIEVANDSFPCFDAFYRIVFWTLVSINIC